MEGQLMQIQCEKCDEIIATTEPGRLSLPLDSNMFDPPTPQYLPPWPDYLQWVDMRCPHCNNCPFTVTEALAQAWSDGTGLGPSRLMTPKGFYVVGDPRAPGEPIPRTVHIHSQEDLDEEWMKRMESRKYQAESTEPPPEHRKRGPGRPPKHREPMQ